MDRVRPDPDELLRRVAAQEKRENRGRLTVFFGAAPGVGKTYSMLEAARAEVEQQKRDVVVGIVETHGRYDTAALVLGLNLLPRRRILHRGVTVDELDLELALERRPDLILVDELAHTNAEGTRHPKRWQDVEELLDAGIDVYTTMNVQHVESLNDVIARITGVVVRETVPDTVLESAHELKLVDLPPDDLIDRLREGKVYVPAQAQRAIENFFKKGNLIALRELALRQTADFIDAQMQAFRQAQGIEQAWSAMDQILVAVSPSPYSARLIRAARRMAGALHARWFAVTVEPGGGRRLSGEDSARLSHNLRLAQQLGAEIVTLSGDNATDEILAFARGHHVTKIIVGKPLMYRWRDRFRGSVVDEIVRRAGDIDVYVTAGDPSPEEIVSQQRPSLRLHVPSFVAAPLAAALSTGLGLLLFGRDQLPDVVMTYLLGIMLVSSRYGFVTSVSTALLSVGAFDFFFVPPFLTFTVSDLRHIVTFGVMFAVAVVISGLTQRIRHQAHAARHRERQTLALYELMREVAAARGTETIVVVAARHLEQAFDSRVSVLLPGPGGSLSRVYPRDGATMGSGQESSVAHWVWTNQKEAGLGTATLPGCPALYIPLMASGGVIGVLGLRPVEADRFRTIDQRRQVDTFAQQMALAIERAELAEETDRARRDVEREQLRSALLSSVSHDLRTPLAVITGAASTLLEGSGSLSEAARHDLMRTILEEAERLNRLILNLLDMTRFESGVMNLKKDWVPLEEVIGSALNRLDARLGGREVRADLPPGPAWVFFDPVLIEQVLFNLLENAAKYGSGPIEVSVTPAADEVVVEVADRGPGIPRGEEGRIFEKFYRLARAGGSDGVGLGLAICRAIVTAHGGRIWVEQRDGGGASFRFALPVHGQPPELALSEADEACAPGANP